MKRICIDARFYRKSTAGVGRYTRGLIHHLQNIDTTNHYTVILTPADYAEWPKDSTPKNWEEKVLDIGHYTKKEQTELLSYLNSERFDLVHFTMFNHPVGYKRPFVVTIHDLTMNLFPNRPPWHPKTWAYRYVMSHAASAARHILVPSMATKKDVERLLRAPAKKITVTLEAVEPEFKPRTDTKEFEQLRKKYNLTKPFLFFVNAWRPHKGLPDLLTAYAEVKRTHDIQLLIAGKPNSSYPEVIAAVEEAQATSPDVLTPGFIPDDDMISLYSMATAFVFPSHYEGFGLGALEALSCGCPTIVANNSSLPEVVGEAGVLFPTGAIKALTEAINKLLDDPEKRKELSRKSIEQAKKFSFDKMAEETLAIYNNVLDQ